MRIQDVALTRHVTTCRDGNHTQTAVSSLHLTRANTHCHRQPRVLLLRQLRAGGRQRSHHSATPCVAMRTSTPELAACTDLPLMMRHVCELRLQHHIAL